jgi:hypothetical protein
MRYLKFKDDETAQVRFALLQLVFQRSRYQPRSSTDAATIADTVKAVNAVGQTYEDDDTGKSDDDERRLNIPVAEPMLRLRDGGGRVGLETSEHKMLLQLIDATPFTPNFMPKVQDLRRWVKSIQDGSKAAGHDDDDTEAPEVQ